MLQGLHGILYEEDFAWAFIRVTIVLGGGAAVLAGRAIASTWRPWWHVALYMLLLGAAVRFIHYALFEATLLSPQYYAVDTAICIICGYLGFRITRVGQMVTQYRWLYERTSPLTWRER